MIGAELLIIYLESSTSIMVVNMFSMSAHLIYPASINAPDAFFDSVFQSLRKLIKAIVLVWTDTQWNGTLKCSTRHYSVDPSDQCVLPLLLKYVECIAHCIDTSKVLESDAAKYHAYFSKIVSTSKLPYDKTKDSKTAPMHLKPAVVSFTEGSGSLDITYSSVKYIVVKVLYPLSFHGQIKNIVWIGCGGGAELLQIQMLFQDAFSIPPPTVVAFELYGDNCIIENIQSVLDSKRSERSSLDLSRKCAIFLYTNVLEVPFSPKLCAESALYSVCTNPKVYSSSMIKHLTNGGRSFIVSKRWLTSGLGLKFLHDLNIPLIPLDKVSLGGNFTTSFLMYYFRVPDSQYNACLR